MTDSPQADAPLPDVERPDVQLADAQSSDVQIPDAFLTVDLLDPETGMAEVEMMEVGDGPGRTFELPADWLPAAAEGMAYRVVARGGTVSFQPLPGGARALRERSKQTLLEFSDEHDGGGPGELGSGRAGR